MSPVATITAILRPVIIPSSARGLRRNFGSDPYTRRRIHATPGPWVSKSVKEKLSAVADKVNKKVGEGLASAIETSEKATKRTKKTLGETTKRARGKAENVHKAKETGNDRPPT